MDLHQDSRNPDADAQWAAAGAVAVPLVSEDRLRQDFLALESFTSTPRGITRLAFSQEDADARKYVLARMSAAGLTCRTDAAGNIIGRREGAIPGMPAVVTGSHIDSVPDGGNFDGAVGVIGGIEALRAISEAGLTTQRPLELIVFASEEAPRFRQSAHRFGSRAMAGLVTLEQIIDWQDEDGITIGEAMKGFGLSPEQLGTAVRARGEIDSMVELHIEQGRLLLDANRPVGIVTTITGTTRYHLTLTGAADHSGATPMSRRVDALAAAAEVILMVERVAVDSASTLVATVGTINAEPGSISVVPGKVELGVDIRDIDGRAKDRAAATICREAEEIARSRGVILDIDQIRADPPVPMSPRIRSVSAQVCEWLRLPSMEVASHAGHDASSLSHITDVGMIFVRNASGRSHSPEEQVEIPDIADGTRALCATLLALARPSDTRHGMRPASTICLPPVGVPAPPRSLE